MWNSRCVWRCVCGYVRAHHRHIFLCTWLTWWEPSRPRLSNLRLTWLRWVADAGGPRPGPDAGILRRRASAAARRLAASPVSRSVTSAGARRGVVEPPIRRRGAPHDGDPHGSCRWQRDRRPAASKDGEARTRTATRPRVTGGPD